MVVICNSYGNLKSIEYAQKEMGRKSKQFATKMYLDKKRRKVIIEEMSNQDQIKTKQNICKHVGNEYQKVKVSISLSVINLHMSNLQCIFGGLYTPINKKNKYCFKLAKYERLEKDMQIVTKKRGGLVFNIWQNRF